MTEQELIDSKVLDHCDKPGCKVCTIPAVTMEMLMEGEL